MTATAATLRVGLSTTKVEPALNEGRFDGIGVYTRALLDHLPATGTDVLPFSFAPPGGLQQLSVGRPLPLSFPVATLGDMILPASAYLDVSRTLASTGGSAR